MILELKHKLLSSLISKTLRHCSQSIHSSHRPPVTSRSHLRNLPGSKIHSFTGVNLKRPTSHLKQNPLKGLIYNWEGKGIYYVLRRFSSSSKHLSKKENSLPLLSPVFLNAENYHNNVAIIDEAGILTYADILRHGKLLHKEITQRMNLDGARKIKLEGPRIALLTENDACYVVGQYATWFAGGVSVPLCQDHPVPMWEYFLENSQCSLILASEQLSEKIFKTTEKLDIPLKVLSRGEYKSKASTKTKNHWTMVDTVDSPSNFSEKKRTESGKLEWFDTSDEFIAQAPALVVYTSGTTGKPKGVVLTHGNLSSMVSGMMKSWAWAETDVILHILPLHHVHGIVNCLLTPLACGATCIMEPKFDAKRVWDLLTAPKIANFDGHINLFMAVPTVYTKLIEYYNDHIAVDNATLATSFIKATTANKLRLMVSGSAALPTPVSERWFEITGHRLLERYGMTEIGMALTNPLDGERVPGAVGNPFPNVEVRIVRWRENSTEYDILAEGNCDKTVVTEGAGGQSGELLIRGSSVFKEYWNNPQATADSFTKDGWFKTGDTVAFENGVYRIVGRTSVDIIKSGGYKISALEVERHLLAHPDIQDCAVVGLPDPTWGQKVAAVLSVKGHRLIEVSELREWAKDYLPPYQIPTVVKCLPAIPRNVMGKVNKKEMVTQIFAEFFDR